MHSMSPAGGGLERYLETSQELCRGLCQRCGIGRKALLVLAFRLSVCIERGREWQGRSAEGRCAAWAVIACACRCAASSSRAGTRPCPATDTGKKASPWTSAALVWRGCPGKPDFKPAEAMSEWDWVWCAGVSVEGYGAGRSQPAHASTAAESAKGGWKGRALSEKRLGGPPHACAARCKSARDTFQRGLAHARHHALHATHHFHQTAALELFHH